MVAPILHTLETHPDLQVEIDALRTLPRPFPEWAHAGLRVALKAEGILLLDSQQAQAPHAGRDVVAGECTGRVVAVGRCWRRAVAFSRSGR